MNDVLPSLSHGYDYEGRKREDWTVKTNDELVHTTQFEVI